ncbi:hypothetical protein GY45DRAFT_1322764 [Cubamyces sp. BRFM 1775]|nr:hypothetical protein GY45DRAFT_1322764 [Cubamyces sp. BRFM 1775]
MALTGSNSNLALTPVLALALVQTLAGPTAGVGCVAGRSHHAWTPLLPPLPIGSFRWAKPWLPQVRSRGESLAAVGRSRQH